MMQHYKFFLDLYSWLIFYMQHISIKRILTTQNIIKMTKTLELQSPTEDILISPSKDSNEIADEKIKMKKHMGLMEGVAIILGIIFGSGKYLFE